MKGQENAWKERMGCDRKEPCETCERVLDRKAMEAELLKTNIRPKKVKEQNEEPEEPDDQGDQDIVWKNIYLFSKKTERTLFNVNIWRIKEESLSLFIFITI